MKRIVYHGTAESDPPHTHGMPFHAGTLRSAQDRIDDELSHGIDRDEIPVVNTTIHAYEVAENAPMSKRVWEDPMFYQNERRAVPEHKENRIYPYINAREDRGSVSYVVPSSFVGRHVTYLGPQFQQTFKD